METITIRGDDELCGTYLLRICVKRDLLLSFGGFQGGRSIQVPKGELAYVGSAMAEQGSMTLERRLLRHATRRDKRNPHQIRERMMVVFKEVGLGSAALKPPDKKSLYWNIDYLLEEVDAELTHVMMIRSRIRFEDELAQFIAMEPGSAVLAKGLGAHDRKSQTHLFIIRETAAWWRQLPGRVGNYLDQIAKESRQLVS